MKFDVSGAARLPSSLVLQTQLSRSRPERLLFRVSKLLAFAVLLSIFASGNASADISYVYDGAGRLIAAIDGSGNAAAYHYDAAGNLTSITTNGPNQTEVYWISPDNSPVGAAVTILGDGFSTTPSQNTVTFYGGKTATVTASTLTAIQTTIPTGALTGTFTVTSPNGSASGFFTVTSN